MSEGREVKAFETALGRCGLTWRETRISGVLMPGSRGLPRGVAAAEIPREVDEVARAIVSLLEGDRTDLRFAAIDTSGLDPFQRRVYEAVREIAAGETASYGEVAEQLGDPRAAREVGVALARNPFPLIVPCHRVLSATGALHGFSAPGGIATKRRLLEIEGAAGFRQQALFA